MKQNLINILKHTANNIFKYAANIILIGVWLIENVVLIFDAACILQPQSELPYPGFSNLTLFQDNVWLINIYIVSFVALTVTCIYTSLRYVRRDILAAILTASIPMVINAVTFYFNM